MARIIPLLLTAFLVSSCSTIKVEFNDVNREAEIQKEAQLIVRLFEGADIRAANPRAVADVLDGRRSSASAAWWGFDAENATWALQAALDSGAEIIVVPNMGTPWLIDSVELTSNQTILFENGVIVEARPGSFLDRGAKLFKIQDKENITLRGYGATLKMRRSDYNKPPYERSQHRHCLAILGSKNIRIYGLTIAESGGDGIYISRGKELQYSANIHIRDVILTHHHRQAISVTSAQDLLIENSRLLHTRGHQPQSGIDFEPNHGHERLVRCVVRNCEIRHNANTGVLMVLKNLSSKSLPVSISVESCIIQNNSLLSLGIFTGSRGVAGRIYLAGNEITGLRYARATENLKIEFLKELDPNKELVPVNIP